MLLSNYSVNKLKKSLQFCDVSVVLFCQRRPLLHLQNSVRPH